MNKKLWITYSWEDNKNGDVEFYAQELEKAGLNVKLDRWNIQTGSRLWEQIDRFISDENESDAWAIIATPKSLGSEPCKEEVAYALDRALNSRGKSFPLIGIFQSTVDKSLIPSAIRTRLYVSVKDSDWVERISSAVEGRELTIPRQNVSPVYYKVHESDDKRSYAIEMRPRAGTWLPFYCGVLLKEKEVLIPSLISGKEDRFPMTNGLYLQGEFINNDSEWFNMTIKEEISPTLSAYLLCNKLPTKITFGVMGSKDQHYALEINEG